MDRQKLAALAALLKESQIPDTQKIKAITAELQTNYYKHPESLLLLIEILCTHEDNNIRQQAAVQAARLAPRHWKKLPAEQKSAVRKHVVESTLKESAPKCRHANARVIATLANIDSTDNSWPELVPALFELASSNEVAHREVGSYIIYTTLESDPTQFQDHVHKLIELFRHTLKDPQSADVRINTVMSIGAMLMLVDVDEDEAGLEGVQGLIPLLASVLRDVIASGDDEKIQQSFEVLQSFLAYDSSLLGGHLQNILQFMIELAANTEADDDVRSQALAFLTQAVRYRRMKIQSMKDLVATLVIKSMQILTEIEYDDDDMETTPARSALSLLDQLSTDLPPRLVLVPLFEQFPKLAASSDPTHRKSAILALGTCAEGAPDFVNTQVSMFIPFVIQLLNDSDASVRHAALTGLSHLADEMPESLAEHHEPLVAGLVKNLQAAMTSTDTDETVANQNVAIVISACAAFDGLSDGLKAEDMKNYAHVLMDPIGHLLSHENHKVIIAASSVLGAIAGSLEQDFKPYFEKTMATLGAYMTIKDSEKDLSVRGGVSDSIARIAIAVGPEMFQPYVVDLMRATEEALNLDNERLRESSFFVWSALSKVYGTEFKPFLGGVFKSLFSTLELEEDEVVLDLTEEEKAIVGDAPELVTGGKRVKLRAHDDEDDDAILDDEEEEDWEDFAGATEAMEKEVAVEVLGDIIANSCGTEEVQQYLEQAIQLATNYCEHMYDGIRQAAVSTLWRAYARVWQLMEEETGLKWEPGFPPKQKPTELLTKLGAMVTKPTIDLWAEEGDRAVVSEINRSLAATLKACGPAVLAQENMMDTVISVITTIITKCHPCQQDLGEEDAEPESEENSEYDWQIVDTALDVIIALATTLGPAFGELWKIFERPVVKLASSNDALERSTAVGTIAECAGQMGAAVTPYTASLLKVLVHRLSDEDPETKSNAAFGTGQVIANSTDPSAYASGFPQILLKVEPMLHQQGDPSHRGFDNAAGCVCRMIMKHPDRMPIKDYLPLIVEHLPLVADYEENKPIYSCIFKLYEQNEPTVMQLTPQFIPLFEKVLSPPEEQLDDETRALIKKAVHFLHQAQPGLFEGHNQLLQLAQS